MNDNNSKLGDLIREKGPEVVEVVGGFVDTFAEKASAVIEAGKDKSESTVESLARKFANSARAAAERAEQIAEEARARADAAEAAAKEATEAAAAAEAVVQANEVVVPADEPVAVEVPAADTQSE